MNTLLKIDSVMYRVSDLQASERFYTGVLGLKKLWQDSQRLMIGFGFSESDAEIVIHSDRTLPDFDYSYLVKDVKAFCGMTKESGGTVVLEPIEVRSGFYAIIADPDSNRLPIIDLTKFGGVPRYT